MTNLSDRLPESKIVAFLESDNDFSVEIELLLELGVYSRKHGAVQSLKKNFTKGVDFTQRCVKTSQGGRPSDSYLLTNDCFKEMCLLAETEVGRLVRRYYIEVEKRWKAQLKNSSSHPDPTMAQLLAQSNQLMAQSQQMMVQFAAMAQQQGVQLTDFSQRVLKIEATQQEAIASLDVTPVPDVEAQEMSTRAKLNRLVRDYCAAHAVPFNEIWRRLYREFTYRYHIDLNRRTQNAKESGKKTTALDVCEEMGKIEELYAVAFELLKV